MAISLSPGDRVFHSGVARTIAEMEHDDGGRITVRCEASGRRPRCILRFWPTETVRKVGVGTCDQPCVVFDTPDTLGRTRDYCQEHWSVQEDIA